MAWLLLGGLTVYAVFLAVMFVVMCQPPQRFGRIMAYFPMPAMAIVPFEPMWNVARGGPARVGDMAPDFVLPTANRKSQVSLSSFRGKQPVVLVFGSYTWPPFRREVPALNAMYEKYRQDAAFFVVYIGEAHPSDAWQLPSNIRDSVVYASPTDADERANLAEICVTRLSFRLPALVDRFDDSTDNAYSGWPDRLFLVDRDGRIVYRSNPGPFGFKPADLERALIAQLPAARSD